MVSSRPKKTTWKSKGIMTALSTSRTDRWSSAICCKTHKAEWNVTMYYLINFLICRPQDFMDCDEPLDLKGNKTAKEELGFGCLRVWTIDFRLFTHLTLCLIYFLNRWEVNAMKMLKRPRWNALCFLVLNVMVIGSSSEAESLASSMFPSSETNRIAKQPIFP